jgi:hypothetical protein
MNFRSAYPRGTSLAELLAVLTGVGVAMAVATGLVHTGMRQQSMSRQELERDRTAMRLARDFREDVRQAVVVDVTAKPAEDASTEGAPGTTLVRLTLPADVRVEYQTTTQGLTRVLARDDRTAHEDYVLVATMQWEVGFDGGCVMLRGTTPVTPVEPHLPRENAPLEIQVIAAISSDATVRGHLVEATP